MWSPDTFIINKSDKKSVNKWKRAILKSDGRDYEFLINVCNDTLSKKEVESYSKYYQCAKFIKNHHKSNYKYIKIADTMMTCCRAYPDICGGVCCRDDYDNCHCDDIPEKHEKLGNCYDDCCAMYNIKHRRKFSIIWL